ncbi:MAG: polyamine aminopropyltransferase [Casimicrobium sp.]
MSESARERERDGERLNETLNDHAGVYFDHARKITEIRTPYQSLAVYDTPELGKLFRLDGCNMTSERDEFFYHENIVHPALIAQDNPKCALVIGGGDGGSTEEILKHPSIKRVVMAELDAEVIAVAREHFQTVHRGALDDPRLEIHIGDGYAYLRETKEKFDAVVMDLTDPIGPAEELYSVDFYRQCDRVLTDTGTLTLHIGSPFFHRERFATSVRRLREVFPIVRPYLVHIPLYGAWWGMACASRSTDALSLSEEEVASRISKRALAHLQFYNAEMHRAVFAMPNFVRELIE